MSHSGPYGISPEVSRYERDIENTRAKEKTATAVAFGLVAVGILVWAVSRPEVQAIIRLLLTPEGALGR